VQIKGAAAIVTGASGGIGLATARLLAARGARVALVARSRDKLEALARELPGAVAIPCDLSDEAAIGAMVRTVRDRLGRVDILVNNAGRGYDAPLERIATSTYRQIFDLDVVGPLVAMQQVIPLMRAQGGGAIVNVSSGTALMHLPGMGGYASLKRALGGLALAAREELAPDKIVVSVVYPYMTATDFEANTIKDPGPGGGAEDEGGGPPFPPDPPDHVAKIILAAIESGEPELYAHDWMKR